MTTIGEAVQMGIGANLSAGVQKEVMCAGLALTQMVMGDGDEPRNDLPADVLSVLTHVMNHLTAIRDFTEVADEYYDEVIPAFSAENPGQLLVVSAEISDLPVIGRFQDIAEMTPEERAAKKEQNLTLIKNENGTLN